MTVAGFLHPLQTLTPAKPMAAPLVGDGATSSGSLRGFALERQLQTEWCWAAVSTSVASFFGSTAWTQCGVASAELAPLSCCGVDAADGCNQPWYLDAALRRVGHFNHMSSLSSEFTAVQEEINGRRPLGCRIAWTGGGAHFVALGGWLISADGSLYVNVCDPFYGQMQKKYADFVSAYMSLGDEWTHSYFTTAAPMVAAGGAPPNPNSPKSV